MSRPPRDEVLLAHVVADALDRVPRATVVSVMQMLRLVAPQLPPTITPESMTSELVEQASGRGLAVDFDGSDGLQPS